MYNMYSLTAVVITEEIENTVISRIICITSNCLPQPPYIFKEAKIIISVKAYYASVYFVRTIFV